MSNLNSRVGKLEAGSECGRRFVIAWQQHDNENLFNLYDTGETITESELEQLEVVADVLVFRVSITA
jgi:hypothetical protein